MSIHALKNLYPGINPHLNSFLQNQPGGWESFHASHILDVSGTLNYALPQFHYPRLVRSLQISEFSDGDEEQALNAVVVFQTVSESPAFRALTRIELLTPASKPGGAFHQRYLSKRAEALQNGLWLVELDYLHEAPPLLKTQPSYPRDPGAFPYAILVTDPTSQHTQVYGFGVDAPVPTVALPLEVGDQVEFDFGLVYNRTFLSSRLFQMLVDYEQEPVNMACYAKADRAYIRQHMQYIATSPDIKEQLL